MMTQDQPVPMLETVFGSHLYGTNSPSSDYDVKKVVIPSVREIIMPAGRGVLNVSTKVDERAKNSATDVDVETFTLRRYVELILEGQTVAMDMLFATPAIMDGTVNGSYSTTWFALWAGRRHLFSRKPAAFLGYCRQQANKYGIKGSRVASARKALEFVKNASLIAFKLYDINDGAWNDLCAGEEFINITAQDPAINDHVRFLEVNSRKIPMTVSVSYAIDVLQKMLDGYGKRAKLAEQNEGVDWKALSHAVRIGEQALEFLQTANISFPRANAEDLKAIKFGKVPYKVVAERIEGLLEDVETASEKSLLPAEPDTAWANEFVFNTYMNQVISNGNRS